MASFSIFSTDEQQQREQQEQQQPPSYYEVTDGLNSPYTKRSYRLAFNHFIKVTVKSDNLRALLDYKHDVIERMIIAHIKYLRYEKKSSYWTIQVHCSGILHFFRMNDISLNVDKIKRFLPKDESERYGKDRPYSVKEIERIQEKCDVRSRVVILLMASTGMRVGALPGLRYGDIKRIDEFGLYMIWAYNRSKADRYYTFCTPECAAAIDAYLDYRRSFHEEIKDKSPLIREEFNIDDDLRVKYPKFLSIDSVHRLIVDVLKRSAVNQIQVGDKRRQVMKTHGFRKFFISQCDKAALNYTVRESLVGHRLPNQDNHYIRKTEEEMLAEYVNKAIPLLTIDRKQRLEQENQDLKTVQAERITRLEQENVKIRQDMKHFLEYAKPALDARSQAASMALKNALGWT